MIRIVDLPLETLWDNSPVISLRVKDTDFFAMVDTGTMMPMYFGNRHLLEKVFGGQVTNETVVIRGANGKTATYDVVICTLIIDKVTFPNMKMAWLPGSDFQYQFLLSYTMFRSCILTCDDINGRFMVDAKSTPDVYVRRPYIVKANNEVFNLCGEIPKIQNE